MKKVAVLQLKKALVSVSDKKDVDVLAKALHVKGVQILSTGGTHGFLQNQGIESIEVSHETGYPEMMNGRVKTLHPKICGAILARRGVDDQELEKHNIQPIDLIIANFYPFEQTIMKKDVLLDQVLESIDVGGPTMVRAAAKNFNHVVILVDTGDYELFLKELEEYGGITYETRYYLAVKAFQYTARYDQVISDYLQRQERPCKKEKSKQDSSALPESLSLNFHKAYDFVYGENPHQKGALYIDPKQVSSSSSIVNAKQHQGKELSYNNFVDADAALACVRKIDSCGCVIVKHANPCGVAVASSLLTAYQRAWEADPISAFGGCIAMNHVLDTETAQYIVTNQFVEIVIAPSIEDDAFVILGKKPKIRVLTYGDQARKNSSSLIYKSISDGILVQTSDDSTYDWDKIQIVSKRHPSSKELDDLKFAWHIVSCVKSNAIVYAQNKQSIGIGAGQMSRIMSAQIAALKAKEAGLSMVGAVMASDAFFPFADSIEKAAQQQVRAIIQPGGSIRDQEVIEAVNKFDMAMIFTSIRHFLH